MSSNKFFLFKSWPNDEAVIKKWQQLQKTYQNIKVNLRMGLFGKISRTKIGGVKISTTKFDPNNLTTKKM